MLRIGTRASPLARWQAHWVASQLEQRGVAIELVLITTEGDVRTGPLGEIGGQGLFTKELQRALLANRIDVAVHSLKDLPTDPIPNLHLAAVPERESPGDVLVSNSANTLIQLGHGARVGTGSTRRRAQLLHGRPDLVMLDVRGNVETRLRKLDEGRYDALVLAEAGLKRLNLAHRIAQVLPREQVLPAVGQGALGIEARADDEATLKALAPLNDLETRAAVLAERALLASLRAGCLAPVGAWGRVEAGQLKLDAVVLDQKGTLRLYAQQIGPIDHPEAVGESAARELLQQGAAELIKRGSSA